MRLQIAICDDEKYMQDIIRQKLLQYKPKYEIDVYCSGEELLEADKRYDLVFLDIEMPGKSGMKVAEELREKGFEGYIVFLTSYSEFMQDAFKVRAFRFLKKPIQDEDFQETLDGVEKEIAQNRTIVVTTNKETRAIPLQDIIYLEVVHNNTFICMQNGEVETRKSLSEWMETLGEELFCQVHRSYAVAYRYIERIEDDCIKMKNTNIKIPVSRKKIVDVRKAFFDYIEKNSSCI